MPRLPLPDVVPARSPPRVPDMPEESSSPLPDPWLPSRVLTPPRSLGPLLSPKVIPPPSPQIHRPLPQKTPPLSPAPHLPFPYPREDGDPIDGHQSLNGSQVASSPTPTCLAPQIGHHGAKLLVVGELRQSPKGPEKMLIKK